MKSLTALIVRTPLSGIRLERSLKAVRVDLEERNCAHCSDAALWNRAFEAITGNYEAAHGPHHFEPALWERAIEAVFVDHEVPDCAHHLDAALWVTVLTVRMLPFGNCADD
eukprot:4752777-Amphidinium_carterae.1